MFARFASITGFRGFALNFLLGGLCVLGHAPFYLWPVSIICFALLMVRLDGVLVFPRKPKAGFWCGFAFAFGYFLFGHYWIGSAFIARGPAFASVMPFAILLFSAGLSLFWALASWLYVKLISPASVLSLWRAGLFAGLIFTAEFARGHMFGGFPWNLPGYIFPAGKAVSQIASYIGVYGLTALTLFLSASLTLVFQNKNFVPFGVGLTLLGGIFIYGDQRLSAAPVQDTQYIKGVKLRIVHANISQKDKLEASKYVENVNRYLRLSIQEGFDDITHVIWPEGAVPVAVFDDQNLLRVLEDLMRSNSNGPPVFITQTGRIETNADGTEKYYNSAAAMWFPKGQARQVTPFYDKQKLVPFGEFMPGGALAEKLGLSTLSSVLASMTPGRTGHVPSLPGLPPASIQICYEIIFSGFTPKKLSPSGAAPRWILNLSNDSWYGNSTGPRQHVNQVRYRAIEQGLPIVRSTSGGISGVIDSFGRQLAQKNLDEEGALDVHLPQLVQKTFFKRSVNAIILLLIFAILLGCWARQRRAL